jgi:hypothetical protein
VAGFVKYLPGAKGVPVFELPQGARNVVVHGTGLDARRGWTLDAALGFDFCDVEADWQGDFVPVADSNVRELFRQVLARDL